MTWAEIAVGWMAGRKRRGHAFDASWAMLMRDMPPDWRKDFGIRGHWFAGTIEGEMEARRTEAWLRDVFAAAWANVPSGLEHLPGALLAFERERVAGPGKSRRIAA